MPAPIVDQAAAVLADPTAYTDEDRLHAALSHLRVHAPVSLVDRPPYRPFWAVTATPTSWTSSATTRCGSTRRARC